MGAKRMDTRDVAFRYVIGIDEAGRGPLAGPVAVAAVCIPSSFDMGRFFGIRDSKQCSPEEREKWFDEIRSEAKEGRIRYSSALVAAQKIDDFGIEKAVSDGIRKTLLRLEVDPGECLVLLDGLLRAPEEFFFQETLIKGDESEPAISLASIVAKVRRDRFMRRLSMRYPLWGFEIHKGYATALHYQKIKENGLSEIHRRSYCKGFTY